MKNREVINGNYVVFLENRWCRGPQEHVDELSSAISGGTELQSMVQSFSMQQEASKESLLQVTEVVQKEMQMLKEIQTAQTSHSKSIQIHQ